MNLYLHQLKHFYNLELEFGTPPWKKRTPISSIVSCQRSQFTRWKLIVVPNLEFNFVFNHHHNRKPPSSNNIWKWTLKLNPMVATKCNAYKSSLSHLVMRNCVIEYSNVTCIGGRLLCLAMGISLDKYEKKLSTFMGIKCLVVRDEMNMQVCTIVNKCSKNKREVF
jgi:hypothetical protein